MIRYQLENVSNILVEPNDYFSWIKQAIQEENRQTGDLYFHFCSDNFLLKINRDFLQKEHLTDILTFPLSTRSDIISGEIFISIDRVLENASAFQSSFEKEFGRVLIHGVLHLIGYNDHKDMEKQVMRSKEDYYLSLLPQK